MGKDEKNLLTVKGIDGQQVLGNAFVAGGHVVSADHVVGEICEIHFDNEARVVEFVSRKSDGQDLSVSRYLVSTASLVRPCGFKVARRGLEVEEKGRIIGHHDFGRFEIQVKKIGRGIGPRTMVGVCEGQELIREGMSGSALLNSEGEVIGPVVSMINDGQGGIIEHILKEK